MKIRADVPIQVYHIVRGCCILALLTIVVSLGMEWYRTKDYIRVDAIISGIIKKLDYGTTSDSRTSVIRYIRCTYAVEGVTYHTQYRTFFAFGKHVGDHVTISYAPGFPQSVRDHFRIEVCVCGLIFLCIFILGMTSAIYQKANC